MVSKRRVICEFEQYLADGESAVKRSRKWRVAGLVLLVVMVSATACDSVDEHKPAPAPSSTPTWPAVNVYEVPDQIRDATMVWSAEPGIDLFSDEGVVTRAAEESALIGLMAGLDYAYIGFASSSDSTVGPVLGDFEADTGRGPFAGTVHGHRDWIRCGTLCALGRPRCTRRWQVLSVANR